MMDTVGNKVSELFMMSRFKFLNSSFLQKSFLLQLVFRNQPRDDKRILLSFL